MNPAGEGLPCLASSLTLGLTWFSWHLPLLPTSNEGGGPGFSTEMRLYPERNLGIVVMGNDTTFNQKGILDLVASLEW